MRFAFSVLCALCVAGIASAQCSNGRCVTMPANALPVDCPGAVWFRLPGDVRYVYCIAPVSGAYDSFEGKFASYNGLAYNPWGDVPAGLNVPMPTGVEAGKMDAGYSINGDACTRSDVANKIGAAVPELKDKWRVVVIGDTDARKAALDKIGKREHVAVNAYPPGHWFAKSAGFDATSNPTVYVMRPDGEEVAKVDASGLDAALLVTQSAPSATPPILPFPVPSPQPIAPQPVPSAAPTVEPASAGVGVLLGFLLRIGLSWLATYLASRRVADHAALVDAITNAVKPK